MATPVASPTAFSPTPGAPATGATQARTAGADSPFQAALTAATQQAQQTVATEAVVVTSEVVTELDELDDPTLAADASLAGLLALATQVLAPPVNEAVSQATGQTALTEPATPVPVDTATAIRTRADQLRLDRSNAFLPNTPAPLDSPFAASRALTTTPATNEQPAVPLVPTATPAAIAARVASRPEGGSSIPAQGQIVANVIPNVPVPANLSVMTPPVEEPTAALAATAVPGTQIGDRSAMAGDRLAADAEAGARLVPTAPPGSVAFANTLAQEITAPPANAATRVSTINTAVPTLPTSDAATAEPAPVVNPGRPVAASAPDARTALPAPTGTEVNFGRLVADTAVPPVQPTTFADESRSADDATTGTPSVVVGPQLSTPIANRGAVIETNAVQATPAAQVADSIVTHARVLERDGGVEFQMRLDPPELGRLQIRLLMRGDEIHGQVLVADEAVRALIESQLPELRQRLEAAGVNVQRFDVSTDPNADGNRNPYREAAPEFFPRARDAASGPSVPRARVGRSDSGSLDVTV